MCFGFKVAINNVVQATSTFVEQVIERMRHDVMSKVLDGVTQQQIDQVFENMQDPFANLQTKTLQRSYIENKINYVKPIEYVLGTRIAYKNKGHKRQITEKEDTMVYIPILQSIEHLLSNSRILDMVLNTNQQNNAFYDICDGEIFKNNRIFTAHQNGLQIILYHDEIEVCNPLGSHNGKHKLDLYYFTLGNLSPKFRSKLSAMKLLAIVRAKDVSRYGQNKILMPICNDLKTLSKGHTFNVNGEDTEIFGTVVCCLGDTEGQHQWGGYKVKVGWAHQKCRNCLCTFEDMQSQFKDTCFTERTIQQYRRQCADIERSVNRQMRDYLCSTYGITGKSLLSDLECFDITRQLPQDIMHVLLEGAVQYEVRLILQQLINDGQITIRQLNDAFDQLTIGYHDAKNRPLPLRESIFDGNERYKLKQTAEQARLYLKFLPFALSGYVTHDNPLYVLILDIIILVQVCFCPVFKEETITRLGNHIEKHLSNFKEMFPDINITPKMHYLLHLPKQICQLGPLVRHSCMRFEARHQYFKEMARLQNFKNICLSLAERFQLDECIKETNIRHPSLHPIFSTEKILGPVLTVSGDRVASFKQQIADANMFMNPNNIKNIFNVKWIQLNGTKFMTNNGCIIAVDANFEGRLPIFGKLGSIWLADDIVIFSYLPLKTVSFNSNLMSYEVEECMLAMAMDFCLYDRLLDFNVYSSQDLNGKLYVPLKYDLTDIIDLHIKGENPLHE